jgi:hypothetical protein
MSNESGNDRLFSEKTFTNQDKRDYCIAWEKSGMNKSVFCKANGLPSSVFYPWYNQFKRHLFDESSFSPVIVKEKSSTACQAMIPFELRLPNQAQLYITLSQPGLVSLIQELCHAATVIR